MLHKLQDVASTWRIHWLTLYPPQPTFSCGAAAAAIADDGIMTGASGMFSVLCRLKVTQKTIRHNSTTFYAAVIMGECCYTTHRHNVVTWLASQCVPAWYGLSFRSSLSCAVSDSVREESPSPSFLILSEYTFGSRLGQGKLPWMMSQVPIPILEVSFILFFLRNYNHHGRPTFAEVHRVLVEGAESKLLEIPPALLEGLAHPQQAGRLGAPLHMAEDLFKELQNCYYH